MAERADSLSAQTRRPVPSSVSTSRAPGGLSYSFVVSLYGFFSGKGMTHRRRSRSVYALLLFALSAGCQRGHLSLAPLPATSVQADQAAIFGRVISSRGAAPLASAVVRLFTPAGALVDSVSADHAGVFVLGPTAPGDYRLEVRMIVHRPFSAVRQLRAGAADSITVRLRYSEAGLIADCIGPERADGTRGFGSQFCRH